MSGVEKRKGDVPEDASEAQAKRARLAALNPPSAAVGAGVPAAGPLSVLERARQALAKKKELEERLKRLKASKEAAAQNAQSAGAAGASAGAGSAPRSAAAIAATAAAAKAKAAAAAAALAAAVKSKAEREKAAAGSAAAGAGPETGSGVTQEPRAGAPLATSTLVPPSSSFSPSPSSLPSSVPSMLAVSALPPSSSASAFPASSASAFFDPSLSSGPRDRRKSRSGALRFLDPGELSRRAEAARRSGGGRSGAGSEAGVAGPQGGSGKAGRPNPNLAPLGRRVAALTGGLSAREQRAPPPAVEWWDAKLLQDKTGYHPVNATTDRGDGATGAAKLDEAAGRVKVEPEPKVESDVVVKGDVSQVDASPMLVEPHAAAATGFGAFSSVSSLSPPPRYALHAGRVTLLVEHPVLVSPPGEAPPPPPAPLRLTPKELRKLRTQRRRAREEEKQELIRRGVLEPPPPKVRLSNLPRVLGELAAADPTAIEREVRRQMAERAEAHADRNAARKLTPMEKRDKTLRKILGAREVVVLGGGAGGGDADPSAGANDGAGGLGAQSGPVVAVAPSKAAEGAVASSSSDGHGVGGGGGASGRVSPGDPLALLTGDASLSGRPTLSSAPVAFSEAIRASAATALTSTHVQVFRTSPLRSRAARYKVRTNAAELHLAGVALSPAGASFSLVVAEGLPKPLRKFRRLLEHRIDWVAAGIDLSRAGNGNGDGDGDDPTLPSPDPPGCHLVWEGEVSKPAFAAFRVDAPQDVFSARATLTRAGVGHYWDAAEATLQAEEQ